MNWLTLILGVTLVTTGHAMTWRDWWETRDQQAQTLMRAGDYVQAEQLFQRPDWRATAAYRAEHYQQAAQTYGTLQTADGYYNAGNALAKMGQFQPAIAAYNQALQRDSQHQDALFNRQIVQKLLDKQKEQQKEQQKQQSDKQQSKKQQSEKQQQQQSSSDPSKNSDAKQSKSEQDKQKTPQDSTDQPSKSKPEPTQPTPKPEKADQADKAAKKKPNNRSEREAQQAKEQWLRLIPDDPAYLLREKFLRDHLNRQNGEVVS